MSYSSQTLRHDKWRPGSFAYNSQLDQLERDSVYMRLLANTPVFYSGIYRIVSNRRALRECEGLGAQLVSQKWGKLIT